MSNYSSSKSVLPFLALALTLACQSSNSSQTSQPSEPSPPDDPADRMLDHFIALTALERAVVRGDLAQASINAEALAKTRVGDPPTWAKRVEELQRAARLVSRETELAEAPGRVIEILKACTGCHLDLGVDLKPLTIPEAPSGETLAAKMQRHQWAMDLLRVGLVFENDRVWLRGSDILTTAPLHPSEVAESGIINPDVVAYANKLRQLASEAKTRKADERLGLYSELLQTCVGCHAE